MRLPELNNPSAVAITPELAEALRRLFTRHRRVTLIKKFSNGLSGSAVFAVRPMSAQGRAELPAVVKIASISMIKQEMHAIRSYIKNRLPNAITNGAQAVLHAESGLGAVCYPMSGSGNENILSLHDFFHQPDTSADNLRQLIDRLLLIMDAIWSDSRVSDSYRFADGYDAVLPPNLLLTVAAEPETPPGIVLSPRLKTKPALAPGDHVTVQGFVVHKVDLSRRTISLRSASSRGSRQAFGVRLRFPPDLDMPHYELHQRIAAIRGIVSETRQSRLGDELRRLFPHYDPFAPDVVLTDDIVVANPLASLDQLLQASGSVHLATVHGDFNLQNILIDIDQQSQFGDINLIDFAEAREAHVLHDLLHLEMEIVTHLLPTAIKAAGLDPLAALADLSWRGHGMLRPATENLDRTEHIGLEKVWVLLHAIRRAARNYLQDPNDPDEYYRGLTLYVLGALRFRNLDEHPEQPLPKQLAFWWAVLSYQWLRHPETDTTPPPISALLRATQGVGLIERTVGGGLAQRSSQSEERLLRLTQLDPPPAIDRLAKSRMLLKPNRQFVGRHEELQQLAATLCSPLETHGGAIAICGMGGLGKTQLAVQFAYSYGRFFEGGVCWIACSDPQVVPTEIAACGLHSALDLAPHFAEFALEEQIRHVLAEWEKPIPRLLIFDNCESVELLARWRPQRGGCRILITSRRHDWSATTGITMLPLGVLQRMDSLKLLHKHRVDASDSVLTAIAHELGDLPLAIHLAGSYLARYRHDIDAAAYLSILRGRSPLVHQSLQAGALSPTEHDSHVARTFDLSYDQLDPIEATTRRALMVMHYTACLAPGTPIPEHFIRRIVNSGTAAPEQADGEATLTNALRQLNDLGLLDIESHRGGRSFRLHRLLVTYTRDRMGEELAVPRAIVERTMVMQAEQINMRRDPAALRDWQGHLRYLTDEALLREDAIGAELAYVLAEYLYQTGDYSGSARYHEQALYLLRQHFGDQHPFIARVLAEYGKTLVYGGADETAQDALGAALRIQYQMKDEPLAIATTLNHLGYLHQLKGRLAAARQCHEQALELRRAHQASHPDLVDSLSNMAYFEFGEQRFAQAHELLEQALALQLQATGQEHPETARVLTNLGELLLAEGRASEAAGVLNRALATNKRQLGEEHPETARALRGLGDVQQLLGNHERAMQYYQQALHIFCANHGEDHPRTTGVRKRLALIRET
jgi:tetratricopeptide (TPR) repeat protein